jgi:hypothetical protein
MCSTHRINFILSCFTLFINLYLIQDFNFSIYNFFPKNDFLLYQKNKISLLWTILNVSFAVVFMLSECFFNKENHIYSYILTCIFDCLYHYFLFNNGLYISLIPLIALFICTIINIYELTKYDRNPILENMTVCYSFWVFFNISLNICFLLTEITTSLFIPILFTLILIISDWLYFIIFQDNYRAITSSLTMNLLNIGLNCSILIESDPHHYSFYSLIFTIYTFLRKIHIIYKKIRNKGDYQVIP